MSEAKRRKEIRHRRDQQEKLWQDNPNKGEGGKDGPSGVGGGGASKCIAKKILVKQLKEWRENEVMMQKKKTQKKMEDDKSGEGDASMDDLATLEGKFKVRISKMQSDSGALAARFLLKDGKDSNSQSYGKTRMTKTMVTRMDRWGWEEEEH
jgi:hypothetical protein